MPILQAIVRGVLQAQSDEQGKLDLLRYASALGFVMAAVSAVSTIVLPDEDASDHRALAVMTVLLVANTVVLLVGRRLPRRAVLFFGVTTAVLATSATVAVARPLAMTPLYYVYPALTAAYFCGRRGSLLHLLLIDVTYAIALPFADVSSKVALYVMTIPVYGVVNLVTLLIVARADNLRDELRQVAATDSLTGLLNRRAFTDAFGRELARADRAGLPLSLVLFDLDHFKAVNDHHGHAAGDDALQQFAGILQTESRPGDLVARMGGEEFAAVLFGAGADGARTWAERVAARLEQETLAGDIPLTTSAGVISITAADATLDRLLIGADRALYTAKAAGRRRVELAA